MTSHSIQQKKPRVVSITRHCHTGPFVQLHFWYKGDKFTALNVIYEDFIANIFTGCFKPFHTEPDLIKHKKLFVK